MTTTSYSNLLALTTLKTVSPERLQRAATILAENSLGITLTRQSESGIRALVKNGEGKEYGVTIADGLITCSCKDALYRGVTCKHAVALALWTIRQPRPAAMPTVGEKPGHQPNLKLAKVRPSWTYAA